MQHRNVRSSAAGFAAVALALGACSGEITGENVVEQPGLRHPSAEGSLVTVDVHPDGLDLRYEGAAPRFLIGDVVWGSEGPGYLRKVTAVSGDGGAIHLATVDAALEDGFQQIQIEGGVTLTPLTPTLPVAFDETFTMTGTDGTQYAVHVQYAAPTLTPVASGNGMTVTWQIPELALSISDAQGRGTLTLSARELEVDKTVTLDAGMDWSWGRLKDLRFVVDDHSRYALKQLAVNVSGQVPLLDQHIPLLADPALATVPVGPLVFTLGGQVDLGLDAVLSAAGELHTTGDVAVSTAGRSGVTWDGAFHPITELTTTVDSAFTGVQLTGRADLSADVSLAGRLRFALYGIAGPELYGTITPVAADLSADPAGWKLALAASATGGVRFVLPFVKLDQLDLPFGSWSQTYYQTSGTW